MFKHSAGYWHGWKRPWIGRRLLCILLCMAPLTAVQAAPSEGELRAAVIVAIMRFTSWGSLSPEKPVLDVCLLGKPLSENVLLSVGADQTVATRVLNVRAVKRKLDACQVMVIGEDVSEAEYEQLIAEADGRSILTVCDGCRRGLGEDAIIQLKLRQQRVSFEVNLSRAKSSGVALDAQLLELAAVVRK